jgi:adenylate cyclase
VFTLTYRGEDGTPRTREVPEDPGGEVLIGRAPTCTLVVIHPTISRQHARFSVRGGRCVLEDLGSTYGTLIDGQRITGEVVVAPGGTFSIGQVEFVCGRREAEGARVVALSEERQIISPSETIYRRVDAADVPAPTPPAGTPGHTAASAPTRAAPSGGDAARVTKLLSEIGKTLVTVQPLPQVLEKVIDLVFESVAAERAILMLRDSAYDALTPRVVRYQDGRAPEQASLSRTVVNMVMRDRVAMLAADAVNDSRLDAAGSIHQLNIRSFMCAPLWNRNEVIGVLYVDNPRSRKFSEDDLTVFVALANYAAVAIEQARLADRLLEETRRRERLQRYHSPGVVNRILNSDTGAATLDTQVRDVSIMFTDIVGFTTMSEAMEPTAVAETLNEFFGAMTDVIFEHQGTLDKFIGDAILAVFGAPFAQPDHALNAVQAAVQMRRVLGEINQRRGGKPLNMRIAIHSGRVLTGDIGSPKRREFTVLGDTVNTTSRLESSVAKPGQIVISAETFERLKGAVRATPLGPVTLRGRQHPIDVFAVED